MRLLGIDYGTKKTGIALSDESAKFAFPHSVINCATISVAQVAREINRICDTHSVATVVLGQSMNFKGAPNPIMREIKELKTILENEFNLTVKYQNEILSTSAAKRLPNKVDARQAKKLKQKIVDASAAALVLQSYLNHKI